VLLRVNPSQVPPKPDEELTPDLAAHVRFGREHTIMLKLVGAFDPSSPFTRMKWHGERGEIVYQFTIIALLYISCVCRCMYAYRYICMYLFS